MIRKVIYELVILYDEESGDELPSFDEAIAEMDDGYCIGQGRLVRSENVPQDEVVGELLALGNDGFFFE